MIVLDASAAVELLVRSGDGGAVADVLAEPDQSVHAPHLLDLEVANALRRLERAGILTRGRASSALEDFSSLLIRRWPHDRLLPRVWELRNNVSAYDAAYLALSESLEAPLLTCDRRLAASSGHRARVRVASRS